MTIEFETKNLAKNESFIVFVNWFPKLIISPTLDSGDERTPADMHALTLDSEELSLLKRDTAKFYLPQGIVMIQFAAESRIDRGEYTTYGEAFRDQHER